MTDDLAARVQRFVSDYWGVPPERLRPNARLEEDLGMTGDDASDFMREFGSQFEIDLTGLEFHKHFGPEGCGCNPLRLLFPPAGMRDYRNYPVTMDHLVRVAETKRWFSPPSVRLSGPQNPGG